MSVQRLQLAQLESKIKLYEPISHTINPSSGWLKAIRLALGMSMQKLADKLHVTKQSVRDMEIREKEGAITLKTLREAARVLDMDLVYGFVPKDGSLENYIDRKARVLAEKIVNRTSGTMILEGQENAKERLERAIEERTAKIKLELPKALWD